MSRTKNLNGRFNGLSEKIAIGSYYGFKGFSTNFESSGTRGTGDVENRGHLRLEQELRDSERIRLIFYRLNERVYKQVFGPFDPEEKLQSGFNLPRD
jgi:hypothetical protein